MFLLITIIISALFAYMGYKKGFFVMFATLFNLMFAIFIAVLSAPKLLAFSPGYEHSGYYAAASMFLLFILVFGVLQFFACFYFLRDCEECFPVLFDKIGAVIFGFLSGYIICCLVMLAFCIMPCSSNENVEKFCAKESLEKLSRPGIGKVCNFLAWYSLHCFEGDSEESIDRLLTISQEAIQDEPEMDTDHSSFENPAMKAIPSNSGGG
jgi:uncharacterized membrane protein required for colicin V production